MSAALLERVTLVFHTALPLLRNFGSSSFPFQLAVLTTSSTTTTASPASEFTRRERSPRRSCVGHLRHAHTRFS